MPSSRTSTRTDGRRVGAHPDRTQARAGMRVAGDVRQGLADGGEQGAAHRVGYVLERDRSVDMDVEAAGAERPSMNELSSALSIDVSSSWRDRDRNGSSAWAPRRSRSEQDVDGFDGNDARRRSTVSPASCPGLPRRMAVRVLSTVSCSSRSCRRRSALHALDDPMLALELLRSRRRRRSSGIAGRA